MEVPSQRSPRRLLRLWFSATQPVDRRTYAVAGFGLAIVKYLGDLVILWVSGETLWSPLQYLNPSLGGRLVNEPWVLLVLGAWAVPFVWIGVSMTARRSKDAGLSAALALLFFIPAVNYLLIATLLCLRSRSRSESDGGRASPARFHFDRDLLSGVALGATVGLLVAALGTFALRFGAYSYALFLGTPFAVGAVSVAVYNRRVSHALEASVGAAQLSLIAACGFLLLFGIEGLVCIAMALPLAIPLVLLGSLFAFRCIAPDQRSSVAAVVVVLPALLIGEGIETSNPPIHKVVTVIEIEAPPEQVWPNVVAFTDLAPPKRWIFKLGIAYPMRARYVGVGVGATRYCEFSTGPFVEPITAWEAPHRLAFDVTVQPPAMHEWSPYRDLQPPHVTTALHTRRGEFRLTPLPGGRTRLEGSTWYGIDLYPQTYWGLWSDALIHQIHLRVLEHVREVTEADIDEPGAGARVSRG